MPSGVYQRTEKHKLINKGRTHTNRKKYFKGRKVTIKTCEYCKKDYEANYKNAKKSKFCSLSCSAKSRLEFVYSNLEKTTSEKQKQSARSRVGTKHPRWIKDRSLVKLDKERGGSLHKQWSKSVKNRDNWKCVINDQCKGKVVAHHIMSWKDYIPLRYEVNNGITLCKKHHPLKRLEEIQNQGLYKNILTRL